MDKVLWLSCWVGIKKNYILTVSTDAGTAKIVKGMYETALHKLQHENQSKGVFVMFVSQKHLSTWVCMAQLNISIMLED